MWFKWYRTIGLRYVIHIAYARCRGGCYLLGTICTRLAAAGATLVTSFEVLETGIHTSFMELHLCPRSEVGIFRKQD